MLYPSDNEFDIPTLRLDMQAQITPPVIAWGTISRGTHMGGTWSFYVDDYRFRSLLKNPAMLVESGCTCATEPNITLYDQSPRAEVIWATYRKRYVARFWQEAGVRVFVDLNVPSRFYEDVMLGVPRGWRSFSTRGYARRPEALRDEWKLANEWAQGWARSDPLLLVYGGGREIEKLCRELPGAVYVPSHMDVYRREKAA